jgi:excisionase family DNA binding protein
MSYRDTSTGGGMIEEKWLTVGEIATTLRVNEQTVRRWLRAGELRGVNFGGKVGYRIRAHDYQAFIEGREGKAAA